MHLPSSISDTRGILCRSVGSADAAPLGRLFEALREAGYEPHFHPHPLDASTAAAVTAYAGPDVYCVAERDGEIVGYGMLRGWEEGYDVPSLGIAVAPVARGTGAAAALMYFLHELARARGADSVRLKVYPDNERALRLYRRLGYVFEGEEDGQLVGRLRL
jgi:ribosomal-protein-alanine N-acetyltransferase